MANKPLLMGPWRNLYGSSLLCCNVTTQTSSGGSVVESEAITLALTVGRDYWISGDAVADSAAGNGDLVAILCNAILAAMPTSVDEIDISFDASGHLELTPTLIGGATWMQLVFQDSTGLVVDDWNRLFGLPDGTVAIDTEDGDGALRFSQLSDRAWYVGKPFNIDSADRDEWVGSVAENLIGVEFPAPLEDPIVRRTVGWENLRVVKVLEEYATAAEPWNTAEHFQELVLRFGRRVRIFADLLRIQSASFDTYRPRNPLEEFVFQGSDDDQIFNTVRLQLVRVAVGEPWVEPGGEPPVIESFEVNGDTEIDFRAGLPYLDFTWVVTGADSLSIDQGIGAVTGSSELNVTSVEGATVYTLTATNAYGSTEAEVTVNGYSIFDLPQYNYDWSYSGHQATSTTWDEEQGTAAKNLARSTGSAPTLNVSTTGLNAAGIGAARVNEAVQGAAGNSGFFVSSGWANPEWNDVWIRVLVRRDAASVSADYLWRFQGSTTSSHSGWRYTGTSGQCRAAEYATASVAQFNTTHTQTEDVWELVDIVYANDGGPAGVATRTIYLNGASVDTDNHSAALALASLTGAFGLLGTVTGTSTPEYCTLLWIGGRYGAANMISLADHQLDAEALGLYTPP